MYGCLLADARASPLVHYALLPRCESIPLLIICHTKHVVHILGLTLAALLLRAFNIPKEYVIRPYAAEAILRRRPLNAENLVAACLNTKSLRLALPFEHVHVVVVVEVSACYKS